MPQYISNWTEDELLKVRSKLLGSIVADWRIESKKKSDLGKFRLVNAGELVGVTLHENATRWATKGMNGGVNRGNYLCYDLYLGSEDVVEVSLNKQVNVRLLDDANYSHYKRGERHSYYGGLARVSPVRLRPPREGSWHLVVDLGGNVGEVRVGVRTIEGGVCKE